MRMRFLPDKPIASSLEDILGFRDFVKLIQTSIYHTETPFVYGVLGDWGSGKTSIMRLLESLLIKDLKNGAYPFVPVWFNAWQYENEANIVYPLLYAIKHDYESRVGALGKAKKFEKGFLQVAATSVLALTDLGLRVATKHLTGESLKLEEIEEQLIAVKKHPDVLERVLSGWADQITELHNAFKHLLHAYADDLAFIDPNIDDKNDVRFVILIDDLDRCLPDTTIAVLESIKNYLAVEGCIFVLGLNPQVIYQGIRIKYKGLEVNGQEYLEKILNYSFYVPEPDADQVAKFGAEQLKKLVLDDKKRKQYYKYFDEFGQVLQRYHFNNPRKIKRILNRYLFFISRYEDTLTQYYNPNIVRLIVLAEYFPNLFQLFLTDAKVAKENLIKVGNPEFNVKEFEDKCGISIAAVYPQLSRMSNLFDLDLPTDKTKPDLSKQARAVFSITRLM